MFVFYIFEQWDQVNARVIKNFNFPINLQTREELDARNY